MAKKFDQRDIQWFGPIWRRIVLVAVMLAWCGLELYGGDNFWFMMTLAVSAYLVWRLFIAFPNADEIAAFEAEQKAAAEQKIAEQAKAEQDERDAS